MGIIKDIIDIAVPRAQKRIEEEGLSVAEALENELKNLAKRYITEVVADAVGGVQFVGGKNDVNQDVQGSNNFGDMNQENYENVNFEEDIPVTREPDMPFWLENNYESTRDNGWN